MLSMGGYLRDTVVWPVQLPGNPKGILYWEVSFQITPATVQLGRGKMLHAGSKIVN